MTHPTPALLFDLDGCLVDSLGLITRCWRATLPRFGLPAPSDALARELAGPPAAEVAARLAPGVSAPRLAELLADYRRRSVAEAATVPAFAGVPELVAGLRARGVRLAIATSRARDVAEPILEGCGLHAEFAVISAPEPHELGIDKATVVGRALDGLRRGGEVTVIGHVGDRAHDVIGAHAHGLRAFGALWGYGGRDELVAAGADALLAAPADMLALV